MRVEVARLDFPILCTRQDFERGQLRASLINA
jgi:hypothetical protein